MCPLRGTRVFVSRFNRNYGQDYAGILDAIDYSDSDSPDKPVTETIRMNDGRTLVVEHSDNGHIVQTSVTTPITTNVASGGQRRLPLFVSGARMTTPAFTVITLAQLANIMLALKGTSIVTLTATTDARLLKTGNPNPDAVKRSIVNGIIGFNYASTVNRQRVREDGTPDFEAKPRNWGERISGTPFVAHKGNLYLEVKPQRAIEVEYFTASGKPLPREAVDPFKREKHNNAPHQGVETEIPCRDYKLDSIDSITFRGVTYMIDPRSRNAAGMAEAMETMEAAKA